VPWLPTGYLCRKRFVWGSIKIYTTAIWKIEKIPKPFADMLFRFYPNLAFQQQLTFYGHFLTIIVMRLLWVGCKKNSQFHENFYRGVLHIGSYKKIFASKKSEWQIPHLRNNTINTYGYEGI